jgi:hypothetical protein
MVNQGIGWAVIALQILIKSYTLCFRYIEENVKMSHQWRNAAEGVPQALQNRPLYLLHRLREEETKAAESRLIVEANEDTENDYSVQSDDRKYLVKLGSEAEKKMPSCSCRSFVRSHLPCKHLMAVMKNQDLDWNCFPEFYRNHPLFVVDENVIPMNAKTQEHTDEQITCGNEDDTQVTPTDCGAPFDAQDLQESITPEMNSKTVANLAKVCREDLRRITDLTYLVANSNEAQTVLIEMHKHFKDIASKLVQVCNKDGGLITTEQSTTDSSMYTKVGMELPRRKKAKGNSLCPVSVRHLRC